MVKYKTKAIQTDLGIFRYNQAYAGIHVTVLHEQNPV